MCNKFDIYVFISLDIHNNVMCLGVSVTYILYIENIRWSRGNYLKNKMLNSKQGSKKIDIVNFNKECKGMI